MEKSEPALGQILRAREIGKTGHEAYEWHACEDCGSTRWVVMLKGRRKASKCVRCATAAFNRTRRGANSPAWKGGRRVDNGYIKVYVPHGHPFESMCFGGRYTFEHRMVIAEQLGRSLRTEEIVHHRDGNRSNNSIENLELTSLGQHSTDHSKGYEHGFQQGYAAGLAAAQQEKK